MTIVNPTIGGNAYYPYPPTPTVPAQYHYHYHYPEVRPQPQVTITPTQAPEPIKVGDWVYSKSKSNPVIGQVAGIRDGNLFVCGAYEEVQGARWSLLIEDAVKVPRPS